MNDKKPTRGGEIARRKTNAEYQKTKREKKRKAGFVYATFVIRPEWRKAILELIEKLMRGGI